MRSDRPYLDNNLLGVRAEKHGQLLHNYSEGRSSTEVQQLLPAANQIVETSPTNCAIPRSTKQFLTVKGGMSRYVSANLTLHLLADSEHVVVWNYCSTVGIIIIRMHLCVSFTNFCMVT